jgi:hypothetical protein
MIGQHHSCGHATTRAVKREREREREQEEDEKKKVLTEGTTKTARVLSSQKRREKEDRIGFFDFFFF